MIRRRGSDEVHVRAVQNALHLHVPLVLRVRRKHKVAVEKTDRLFCMLLCYFGEMQDSIRYVIAHKQVKVAREHVLFPAAEIAFQILTLGIAFLRQRQIHRVARDVRLSPGGGQCRARTVFFYFNFSLI